MPAKPSSHPIVIKFAHLSPPLKALIGSPFDGVGFTKLARFLGVEGASFRLARALHNMSLPELYNITAHPPSLRGSRTSRFFSEAWGADKIKMFWTMLEGMNSGKTYHEVSTIAPGMTELAFSFNLMSRIESVRLVQFLHEKLASEIRSSKALVNPKFAGHYSTEAKHADLVSQTHPIFRVNLNGDLVFLPVTRREYQQYRFQQSKFGKLGVQPWLWRGYLEPPKAPLSWKKEAAQKLKEWSERVRENWRPAPRPRPALVRVKSVSSPVREKNPRRVLRKR